MSRRSHQVPSPLRSLFLIAAVSLLLASPATTFAQDEIFTGGLDNVHSRVLDNGLEVVVIEDHSMPLVTVEVSVHNGAFTEPPELNGLSHLYEHMFFKGNGAIPNQEAYMARQRELGMVWNGTTSEERVNYYFTLGSDQICEGMVFMANALMTPQFDREELEREREVVLGEFDRNEANPYWHLRHAVSENLWRELLSRKEALGDRPTISTATPEQMRFMQQTYYVPNNSALFLAGDVTPDEGFALAEQVFGAWPRGADPFEAHPPVAIPPLTETTVRIVDQPVQAVTLMAGWHGPSVSDDPAATFAADVFSYIIGQQAHRFQQNLVDSGLALGVNVSYYTQANTGPIFLMIQALPQNVEAALAALNEEMAHFTDADYFSDDQLQTAKTLLAVGELYSRQQTSGWVHTVSFWWAVAGLDYYRDYVTNMNLVTREDINRYIDTYITGQPHVLGVLTSPEIREQLNLTEAQIQAWAF